MEEERLLESLINLANKQQADIDFLKSNGCGQNTINAISRLKESQMWINEDIVRLENKIDNISLKEKSI